DARDTVQLARYADVIAERGGRVVLECQPELVKLMASCRGVERVVAAGGSPPPHDYHVALLSLPAALRTPHETLPAAAPYLGVDAAALEAWRRRLEGAGKIKIAVALNGDGEATGTDDGRSLRSSLLRKLGPNAVTLIDLQGADDAARRNGHPSLL